MNCKQKAKELFDQTEKVMEKHKDLGAWDTEPSTQCHLIVRDAVDGKPYPEGIRFDLFWGAFSKEKLDKANDEIDSVMKSVYNEVRNLMPNEELKQALADLFWRSGIMG
jgi:hypothetical protein